VILLTVGNMKNNDLINLFEANLDKVLKLFEQNRNLVIFGTTSLVAY